MNGAYLDRVKGHFGLPEKRDHTWTNFNITVPKNMLPNPVDVFGTVKMDNSTYINPAFLTMPAPGHVKNPVTDTIGPMPLHEAGIQPELRSKPIPPTPVFQASYVTGVMVKQPHDSIDEFKINNKLDDLKMASGKSDAMEFLEKNWMYLAGGAVLFFVVVKS